MWPLALQDGSTAIVANGTLWFVLSAPRLPDPVDRHGIARIRLVHQQGELWHDCGNALPDGASPGSREWAGTALLNPASGAVTLFFTAAGRRDETRLTFEQRLVQSTGLLDLSADRPAIRAWSAVRESVASDGDLYVRANQAEGAPGTIKAFRDPAYFQDPLDQQMYLVFAASLAKSTSAFNGCVGLASGGGGLESWTLQPPLLLADGVNNELERPHVVFHSGKYYLFWSTQTHTFAPDVAAGPNGLYGAVASHFRGPYAPLNGSGLVCANPESEPTQAYSWWVQGDGCVVSFVDYWGMKGRSLADHPELVRCQFGGVPAPRFRLRLDGQTASIA
jgi:levansucrase